MCGIGGIISNVSSDKNYEVLEYLLLELEERGKDAAGVVFLNPDRKITYRKEGIEASKLLETLKRKPVFGGLVHTRAKTQGLASDNNNNHPIIFKDLVLIHNGVVRNDVEVISEVPEAPEGMVDSRAIAAVLADEMEKEKDPIKAIQASVARLRGELAVAFTSCKKPNTIYLIKSGARPLIAAHNKAKDMFIFASTREAIEFSLPSKVRTDDIFQQTKSEANDLYYYELDDNVGLAVTMGEKVSYEKFEVKQKEIVSYNYSPSKEEEKVTVLLPHYKNAMGNIFHHKVEVSSIYPFATDIIKEITSEGELSTELLGLTVRELVENSLDKKLTFEQSGRLRELAGSVWYHATRQVNAIMV